MEKIIIFSREQKKLVALVSKSSNYIIFGFQDSRLGIAESAVIRNVLLGHNNIIKMNGSTTLQEVFDKCPESYTPIYEGDEITIKF